MSSALAMYSFEHYLFSCFRIVWILVWVEFEGQASVCLLHFLLCCSFWQTQQLIQRISLCPVTIQTLLRKSDRRIRMRNGICHSFLIPMPNLSYPNHSSVLRLGQLRTTYIRFGACRLRWLSPNSYLRHWQGQGIGCSSTVGPVPAPFSTFKF